MLQRLLESEQFSSGRTSTDLLKFLFRSAIDRSASPEEIRSLEFMKRVLYVDSPRPEISRVRSLLKTYFAINRGHEDVQAVIQRAPYQVVFVLNDVDPLPASALDRFWLPFIKGQSPVSIRMNPLTCFRDSDGHVENDRSRGLRGA